MKRALTLVLVIAMILPLGACGKSGAVQAADDKIISIGSVSLKNEQPIIEAEDAVSALTDKDKGKLDNLQVLVEARASYNEICVKNIESNIRKIGTVSINNEATIIDAEKAVGNLAEDLRDYVDNLDVLEDSRTAYNNLLVY